MPVLFERLTRHARRTAELRRRALAQSVAQRLTGRISGIVVAAEGDQVVLNGRSLHRRWLVDGQLRFLGKLVR